MIRRFFFFFLCALPLSAATFTIEGAVQRAVRSNPDLAAARWSIEQARGRLMQSGRLSNPELEMELKPNVRGREGSFSLGFTQKFPRTHRLFYERAVSQAEFAAAEAEVRNAERLLRAEVRTTAVKLLSIQSRRALKEEQRKNSAELAADAEKAAKAGEGSALDAAHFELEQQQLSLDLLTSDAEAASLQSSLRPLLGMGTKESLSLSGTLAPPEPPARGVSPAQRGDYQAALAKEEAARAGVDLARAGKWEDPEYGLYYEREHADDEGAGMERENFLGFKLTLPLPLRNKNEGKIHEAEASAAKARDERAALALRIHSEAATARVEMNAAAKIIEQTTGPLLARAKDIEERHVAANKLGQAPIADVLRSRALRFSLDEARLSALRDYHLARVRLLSAQGR
jgi:cobalt-zinc-cadmium efflux system outer membrane protein